MFNFFIVKEILWHLIFVYAFNFFIKQDEILVRVSTGNEFLAPMYGILAQALVVFLFSLFLNLKKKRKTSLGL